MRAYIATDATGKQIPYTEASDAYLLRVINADPDLKFITKGEGIVTKEDIQDQARIILSLRSQGFSF